MVDVQDRRGHQTASLHEGVHELQGRRGLSAAKALIIQHSDTTTPGSVPSLLAGLGVDFELAQLHRGVQLGRPTDYDLIVLCGGGVHVNQEDRFPFLGPEKTFLRSAVDAGVKTIGLCLGAQLLAVVLGGQCEPHPHGWEIGWQDVDCEAVPGLRGFERRITRRVSQYHRFFFDLPPGARRVAGNAWCETQGFLYGDHVLAFGFHPERTQLANAEMAREIGLPTTGRCQTPAEILSDGPRLEPLATPWFREILAGFTS